MLSFGKLLRTIREEKNLSRAQLAEGICSEKYLYLIEKGERMPSATILRQLSQALQTDLFRYYRFIDYEDPVAVERVINEFMRAIRTSDYKLRGQIVKEAEQLKAYKKPPWSYVLIGNRAMHNLIVKREYEAVYIELKDAIDKIKPVYEDTVFVATIYLAFSYSLQYLGQYEESYQYALLAERIHKESIGFYYGDGLYYLAESRATILNNLYKLEKYQKAVDYGEGLIKNLANVGTYARLEASLGYLAFSLYRLNRIEDAVLTLRKAMQLLMLTRNEFFLYYLLAEKDFKAIVKEFPSDDNILKEFQLYIRPLQIVN
ncbi:MAG: helix-turn-helix transcriptional regulator [Ignavibacteria bacterium]|nr:helix-turn-helix transcriptional regulator [Ignavibacteria bacterium]